ncbi:efflux RND transporter permease subunit [Glaciecola sp. 1036]|uniref:efflux RND transporter permease subunit n=1 Tax=Alteromonadaceae TaxID=72275 RepID=UPI003D090E71
MHNFLITLINKRTSILIFSCLLIIVLTSIGAKNLYFRGDYRVFFEPDNPQRVAYEQMQKAFSKNESASIVISAKNGDLFNQQSLALIKKLTEQSWQTPLSLRVDSITNYQRTYLYDEDLVIEDLVPSTDNLSTEDIQTIRQVSLSEPELINKLISEDGSVAMINITVQLPNGDQTKEINQIGAFLRDLIQPVIEENEAHEIRLSGLVIMTDSFFLAAQKDAMTLFPLMFAIFALLLTLFMKTFKGTLFTLLIVMVSIASTMGLGGWLGMFINVATVNVPVIIMTLAIADCVHIISSTRKFMEDGYSQQEAIGKSLEINLSAVLITSTTTALGFLTLNFAEVPVLHDMGNLVAIGVIFACGFSIFLLPALLKKVQLPFTVISQEQKAGEPSENIWHKYTVFLTRYCKPILVSVTALFVCFGYLASQNQLNDIPIDYFNKGNEFREVADYQQENLTGLTTVDLAIDTGEENGIFDPKFLAFLDEFTSWLREQPEVDHVLSYADILKRLNKVLNQDNPDFYSMPEKRTLAAQYTLLYEMSLPYGLDVNNQLDISKSRIRLIVTTKNLGSIALTDFESRAKLWVADNGAGYTISGASIPLIFAHISESNMDGILEGTIVALLLISVVLFFALRNVKLGVISLIPNIFPAVFGFGIWYLFSGTISMALAVVMIIPLGIIVDDTVHFLVKYQSNFKQSKNSLEAVNYAFKHVSKALIITTIVLASGFSVLGLSDFAINSEMGILTATIIVLALAIDLIVLPSLLLLFYRNGYELSENTSKA